jgi:hypothetical protein
MKERSMKSISSVGLTFLLLVFAVTIPSGDLMGQYAGSERCLLCHNGVDASDRLSWRNTFHHLAYADPDTLPGVVPDTYFQSGTNLQTDTDFSQYDPAPVLGYDPADPGDPTDMSSGYQVTIGNITYTVNRTHGGNGWGQLFHTKIGNSNYVLPVQYNLATDDWVAYHAEDWYDGSNQPIYDSSATLEDEIDKPDASERRCDGCHTTGFKITWNATGDSAYVAMCVEEGVGCEICHGPLDDGFGHGPKPSDLENTERANEVCGQCHNRGTSVDQLGPEPFEYPWNSISNLFVPGDSLDAFFIAANPIDHPEYFWPDDVNSSQYRQQFLDLYKSIKPLSSMGEVRCYNCHNPHGTDNEYDIVKKMVFVDGPDTLVVPVDENNNTLCLSCHSTREEFTGITREMVAEYETNIDSISAVVTAHTHHPYDPEDSDETNGASRCSRCHMPPIAILATEYDLHSHVFKPIPPENTINTQAEGGMPSSCAVSCHRNPLYTNIPDWGLVDGTLGDWTEPADVALATLQMLYYGPNGLWWQTGTGIGDNETGGRHLPRAYTLSQNYPNPFNPSTTITFSAPANRVEENGTVAVTLCVYSLRGALVKTLLDGGITPGKHSIHWNGRSDRGEKVSSGIYLYRLEAGDFSSTRKMVVVK